jgi:hypothetical protein
VTEQRRAGAGALGCFVLGAAILLVSEPDLLRMAGALLMLAAVFLGVGAVATPELLGGEEDEDPAP